MSLNEVRPGGGRARRRQQFRSHVSINVRARTNMSPLRGELACTLCVHPLAKLNSLELHDRAMTSEQTNSLVIAVLLVIINLLMVIA